MEKPEPLKDKCFSNRTITRTALNEGWLLFKHKDVKGAVEWLKNEDSKSFLRHKEGKIDIKALYDEILENKTKAFQDIYKKGTKI